MRTSVGWRCACIAGVIVVAVFVLLSHAFVLGLDLRGGVHLVLQVDVAEGLRREAAAARERGEPFAADASAVASRRHEWVEQARQVIERRVNALGVGEATIAVQGAAGDQLLVELPGISDVERAKAVIQSTGLLELTLVEAGPVARPEDLPAATDGVHVIEGRNGEAQGYYAVRTVPVVSGAELRSARPSYDEFNQPAVAFTLTQRAAERFATFTEAHVGRRLAIVVDGKVHSAAAIEGRIGADGVIRGGFTPQEAQDLAVTLRSGALRVPLHFTEQQTIGASLGADAVRDGVAASLAGAGLVGAFMLAYYRGAGVNAVLAMLANLTILLAVLAYVGAAITLPGIAGLVLTIGIGVDSNVLIFERIKEEIAGGAPVPAAVRAGFDRVFRTLLDTHVSALIGAAFLYQFGTSAVRGFAVTLSLGLLVNLFTSTFVSRTLFEVRRPGAAG